MLQFDKYLKIYYNKIMTEIPRPVEGRKGESNPPMLKEPYVPTHATKNEAGLEEELKRISFAIDAEEYLPSPIQEQVMNGLLERAGIPLGKYSYSPELLKKILEYGKTLSDDIQRYNKETNKGLREKKLQVIFDRTEHYTENVIQQFVLDNTLADGKDSLSKMYQTKRMERIRDTYKIDLLAAQMKIAASLVTQDGPGALDHAEKYIRSKYIGLQSKVPVDDRTEEIMKSFSANLVEQTQKYVVPVLEKNVREFAKKSFVRSFWNRAKQTGSFALDWVSVPFSDKAKDRMAKSMTPLAELGPMNALKKTAPIVCDFAKTAYNISINHQEALALLASTAGAVSFDIALTVATWGVGAGIKGAHLAGNAAKVGGTAVKSLSALSAGFAVGKTTLRPLYGLTNKLSFAKLEEKVHNKIPEDTRS
jgi:hypothetical protein